jgi:hypothetical protein
MRAASEKHNSVALQSIWKTTTGKVAGTPSPRLCESGIATFTAPPVRVQNSAYTCSAPLQHGQNLALRLDHHFLV